MVSRRGWLKISSCNHFHAVANYMGTDWCLVNQGRRGCEADIILLERFGVGVASSSRGAACAWARKTAVAGSADESISNFLVSSCDSPFLLAAACSSNFPPMTAPTYSGMS